jgi:hypothetical protein
MEGYCLTGQSSQRAAVPMEEEEEELTSECFEQAYCSSSGGQTLYKQQLV